MNDNFGFENRSATRERQFVQSGAANAFLRQVFTTMTLGLLITGMAAWWTANTPAALNFFYTGVMRWIVMLAPLGLVFFLASRVHRMSFQNASIAFAIYSLVNGISLAFIFIAFTGGTITKVFFITAGMFGAMALVGLTTKTDLTKFRSILFMGLIGIIIAMVVNWFLKSDMMSYIISVIGVVIFAGLTAYDTQKMLVIGANVDPEAESSKKMALIGALSLYLDFINLFLFLLRIFGGGRD